MWIFNSSIGLFIDPSGTIVTALAWSGHDAGRNSPVMEQTPDIGPIPRGYWTIGAAQDRQDLGPIVFALTPEEGTDTYGRSGFYIHGASFANPAESSHGCIILPRPVRLLIKDSPDRRLSVIAT